MAFPIDHDLHCHSQLSSCSNDPEQTVQALLDHAKKNGYTVQCVTDHFWDEDVPGPSNWYRPQGLAHVKRSLPLPKDDQVRMVFGCETEFCGGKKLGIDPAHYDDFDFIVIPPNHFHMEGFTRDASIQTEAQRADLLVERLEEISMLDLPWHKVGIAHLTCSLTHRGGDHALLFSLVDEKRFRAVMHKFATLGCGIELNSGCFDERFLSNPDSRLKLYRMAKEEGCKFYLASDAHHLNWLDSVPKYCPNAVEMIGLTEKDLFRIPE